MPKTKHRPARQWTPIIPGVPVEYHNGDIRFYLGRRNGNTDTRRSVLITQELLIDQELDMIYNMLCNYGMTADVWDRYSPAIQAAQTFVRKKVTIP